jgi:hypothetical protein
MSASPRIWLLEPSAGPEDGCWQGRPIWQLAVAAPSAAFARLAAERWARDRLPHRYTGHQNSAGFGDQRLYHARPLAEGGACSIGDFTGASVLVLAGPMASVTSA